MSFLRARKEGLALCIADNKHLVSEVQVQARGEESQKEKAKANGRFVKKKSTSLNRHNERKGCVKALPSPKIDNVLGLLHNWVSSHLF